MRLQGLRAAILLLSLAHAAFSVHRAKGLEKGREKEREKEREKGDGGCPVKKKSATFSELRSAAHDLLVLQGEPLAAASCLQRALKRSQGVVQPKERLAARRELANALQLAARFAQAEIEAEALLDEARTLGDDEELASALEVVSDVALVQGKVQRAQEALDAALETAPPPPSRQLKLGVLLERLGRLEQAVQAYDRAMVGDAVSPLIVQTTVPMVRAMVHLGRYDEAVGVASRWLDVRQKLAPPIVAQLLLFRAGALVSSGEPVAAAKDLDAAAKIAGDSFLPIALWRTVIKANVYAVIGQNELHEAEREADGLLADVVRVLDEQTKLPMMQQIMHSPLPLPLIRPEMALALNIDPKTLLRVARAEDGAWTNATVVDRETLERQHALLDLSSQQRLHIGIVTAEMQEGAPARTLLGLLQAPRPSNVQISLYCLGGRFSGELAQAAREAVDFLHVLEDAPVHAVARHIADDKVHVLLYPHGPLPQSLRPLPHLRPAPVQAAWATGWNVPLGAGTNMWYLCAGDLCSDSAMGPSSIGPRLALLPDAGIAPLATLHSAKGEAGGRKPPRLDPPESAKLRHDLGLPLDDEDVGQGSGDVSTRGVIFCSATPWDKVGPRTLALWLDLLARSPTARLLTPQFSQSRKAAAAARVTAENMGLASRLHFWRRLSQQPLERVADVCDAILEPLDDGSALAQEAVTIGIPVLAHNGDTLAARRTAAVLRVAGLVQHVAQSPTEYVELAEQWAGQPEALQRAARDAAAGASRLEQGAQVETLFRALQTLWQMRKAKYREPLNLEQLWSSQEAAAVERRGTRPPLAAKEATPEVAEQQGDDTSQNVVEVELGLPRSIFAMRAHFGKEARPQVQASSNTDGSSREEAEGAESGAEGVYVIEPIALH